MSEEDLRSALESLPFEVAEVAVHSEGRRLIGVVVAAKFEDMDEAERQRLVWHHLRQSFSDQLLVKVEFVFTNTPREDRELASA